MLLVAWRRNSLTAAVAMGQTVAITAAVAMMQLVTITAAVVMLQLVAKMQLAVLTMRWSVAVMMQSASTDCINDVIGGADVTTNNDVVAVCGGNSDAEIVAAILELACY